MPRIRTIKPEFFSSEDITELSSFARLLYIGLWCEADREGRFVWKPKTFKIRYLPCDDVDIFALLDELLARNLVILYDDGLAYIPCFTAHQFINNKEPQSVLPEPKSPTRKPRVSHALATREERVLDAPSLKEDIGKEDIGKEDIGNIQEGGYGGKPKTCGAPSLAVATATGAPPEKPPDSLEGMVAFCVEALNAATGRRYQASGSACKHLRARLRNVLKSEREDVVRQAVLVLQFKASQWLGDAKMRSFLRPETLWCPGHWETYSQEATEWDEQGRPPAHRNGKAETAKEKRDRLIAEIGGEA